MCFYKRVYHSKRVRKWAPKAGAVAASAAVITVAATQAPSHTPTPTPSQCVEHGGLPDPSCTPGATNPNVTQANIKTTICLSGYTATIRPPASYTTALKRQQISQYGYADHSLTAYEEDHLISLEIGGNPTSPQNLWPEPYAPTDASSEGAHVKDQTENRLHAEVCAGTITLAKAQQEISQDWQTAR